MHTFFKTDELILSGCKVRKSIIKAMLMSKEFSVNMSNKLEQESQAKTSSKKLQFLPTVSLSEFKLVTTEVLINEKQMLSLVRNMINTKFTRDNWKIIYLLRLKTGQEFDVITIREMTLFDSKHCTLG